MNTKKWIFMVRSLFRTIVRRSLMNERIKLNSIHLMPPPPPPPIHTIILIHQQSVLSHARLTEFQPVAFCDGDNGEITNGNRSNSSS